jgi:hypothetical protein
MTLRKRLAALTGGLLLAVALAVPVLADDGGARPDIADLPPEIQAAIAVAQAEHEEAREARAAVHEVMLEIHALFDAVDDRADVDQEQLAELRAEAERLDAIARAESEEARAAHEEVRALLIAAGYDVPEERPDRGDGEGRPPRGDHSGDHGKGERGEHPGRGKERFPDGARPDGFPGRGGDANPAF